jgi:hypothetical protein
MDINRKIYVGIVEENIDPKRYGRIKVRVQNIFDEIPKNDIPWSSPHSSLNGKTFDIPELGKIVNVIFDNDSIYFPYYIYSNNYNINLQDKLESLSNDDYTNFVSLLFDHRTRIYSETDSFTIDFKVNKIKMDNDSINIDIKDDSRKINLGSENADQNAVLGTHFIMEWFLDFLNILSNPMSLVGNLGAPIIKPEIDAHIQKFISNPNKFISQNVFIVDNNKVTNLERNSVTSSIEHDDTIIVNPKENSNGIGNNIEQSDIVNQDTKDDIATNQQKEKQEIADYKPIINTSSTNSILPNSNTSNNNVIKTNNIDTYSKSNVTNNRKISNSKYTIDKRNRGDELNSNIVSVNKNSNNSGNNQNTGGFNPNYGNYI